MQNALKQVLSADRDMSFTFSKKELKRLQINLSNIPGVTFDKANFEKLVYTHGEEGVKMGDLMQMFRNLKDKSVPEADNIFHLEPEKLLKTKTW
jgi:hypothetical protein